MKKLTIAVPTFLLLAACGPLPPNPGVVDDLRILAVQADPPEVAPGEPLTMSALVADPLGAGRAVDVLWGLCIPDPVEFLSNCNSDTAFPVGSGESISYVVPANFLDTLDPELREVGLELFLAVFATADTEEKIAFKRIRISESTEPNVNPELLTTNVTGTNPTEFEIETNDPDTDVLAVTWLSDVGAFDRYQSYIDPTETSWTKAMWSSETAQTGTVWIVVRDSRGGTTWTSYLLQ